MERSGRLDGWLERKNGGRKVDVCQDAYMRSRGYDKQEWYPHAAAAPSKIEDRRIETLGDDKEERWLG
jgi:hypothetical protein